MASIFARIAAGEIPSYKVAADDRFFAFLDINPVDKGHVLVIPRAEVDYICKIPKEKLFVYHINDCEDLPLRVLDHCHRIMPGKGCIPIAEVSKAVMDVGYDGPACVELFRPEYWAMDAEAVIKMGADTTRPFLG